MTTLNPSVVVLSSITHEAIKNGSPDLKRSHRNINGNVDMEKPVIVIPCKPQLGNTGRGHWILVIAVPSMQK